ncbi:MAG: hypothetical protein K9J16_11640 [Melioribacteraceae bacterium]|nr:hypothetical protein [Melioribacteraceae bacterium]MCF8354553.1 hypothetical protein [Melioribacteraceae bacterium]MCF8394485.1 hypothetical protein [Melioribacteraceae bacterium]MCF8420105.1 hypothetical protein [Melioribacteraceae bacterium]
MSNRHDRSRNLSYRLSDKSEASVGDKIFYSAFLFIFFAVSVLSLVACKAYFL